MVKNKFLFLIVLALIIAVAGFVFLSKPTVETEKTSAPETDMIQQEKMLEASDVKTTMETAPQEFDETKAMQVQEEIMKQETIIQDQMQEKKVFNIDAMNYSFSIKEIRVKKGDAVKITLNNVEGFHDWTIDEFNAQTAKTSAGQSVEIEFIADKTGNFEYYCSVGNHRQQGMIGKFIVE